MRVGVFQDVVPAEPRDRLLGAGDISSERMVGPDQLFEEVLHQVLRLVLVHAQLFEDHHPFALHVGGVELGVGDDVEQHIETEIHVLRRHARPVGGQLLVGGSVDEPSNALDRIGDLLGCRPPLGAFEEEVLDEVRHAGEPVIFEPRSAAEHENNTGRVPFRHRLHDQPGSPRKQMDAWRKRHGTVSIRTAGLARASLTQCAERCV